MAVTEVKRFAKSLEALRAERDKLSRLIEGFELAIMDMEGLDDAQGDGRMIAAAPATASNPIDEEMWRILVAEGKPLHYTTVYERLVQLGITVPGKDPARNTGAHLSIDKRFESLGSGMWRIRAKETTADIDSGTDAFAGASHGGEQPA